MALDGKRQTPDGDKPLRVRALGLWARCWQLAGGVWPPPSRAITHQIVMMLARYLQAASGDRLSWEEALGLARETMAPLTAQRFYPGGEQDVAVDHLAEAIVAAESGRFPDLPPDLLV